MSQEFKAALTEILDRYGIELPRTHGTDEHHSRYQTYLAKRGLEEKDVDPIIDRSKISPEAHAQLLLGFIQATKENDKKLLAPILDMMATIVLEQNTNRLIGRMVHQLLSDLSGTAHKIPEFFAGVAPTNSINAQCVYEGDLALVLIDTGCFDMIEAAMTSFVSKRNETEQAELLIRILEDYFINGIPIDPLIADHPSINWGNRIVSIFCTAIEEFVIAHELGHLVLGHISNSAARQIELRDGSEMLIQTKNHKQEYQADVWALRLLAARAKNREDSDLALELACSGVLMFLTIGLMIEAMAESRKMPIRDTHPPIENRMYLAEVTCDTLGLEKQLGYARKFRRLVREFCVLEGVAEKNPPLLSRELNQIAVETYKSLDIDYKHVSYLTDFI